MTKKREQILALIEKAEKAIPSELKADLPPGQYTSGAPEWYDFEYQIWDYGEKIRQLLTENKSLRRDIELQRAFVRVACNSNAKRGRQSFVMLLGYVCCAQFAVDIASQLTDPCVDGHVIDTLTKMRCSDFVEDIKPFTTDKTAWVRKAAKQYIQKYGGG